MYNLRCLLRLNLRHGHRIFSSTYKRSPRLNLLQHNQLEELKEQYFIRNSALSNDEWHDIRHTLLNNYKHINLHNVDATILGACSAPSQLPLAKNYLAYLRSQGLQPNAAILGRLLRIYHSVHEIRELTEMEQNEILEIYNTLRNAHETLDATTCEHLIYGLVTNPNHWQRAVELLEMIKVTTTPSVNAYSILAAKAFTAGELELAWSLLNEMAQSRKLPKCEVYLTYLQQQVDDNNNNNQSEKKTPEELRRKLEHLLQFLERHNIVISAKVVEKLLTLSNHIKASATIARVDRLGKCSICCQHLQHVAVTEIEFKQLQDSFLNKVLIRNDVFQKSTPEEITRFKRFVEKTAPYDCVIDGLNVAYSTGNKKSPQQLAKLVADVVRYFNERQKHVLVLGRKHMRNWSKQSMQYIQSNACVFLTNDLSQDDPFLLYATLKSGPDTDFFSRDLMRSHAFLMGNELKPIFLRWQQQHQYSLVTQTQTGQIIVKEPMRYRLCAHKSNDNVWHIPYCENYTPHQSDCFEVPDKWLCLKFK